MDPAELHPAELLQLVADHCEAIGINYRVVGSMASLAYGDPRLTNDVDMLIDLPLEKVRAFCAAFPEPDFFIQEPVVRAAVARRFQFNIIHIPTSLKVDVILPPDTEYGRLQMSRGKLVTSEGEFSAWFGAPEDLILSKLRYYQEGGSEKHLRDIAGMMKLLKDKLDRAYISEWAPKLGVTAEWKLVCDQIKEKGGQ